MLKRILILGLAAVALALIAPAIGVGGAVGVGGDVAQAQTDPNADAPDQGDTPDAPDQGDTPDAPDQGDTPDAPDSGGDAEDGPCDSSGARASGDSCPQPKEQPSPTSRPEKESHEEESGGGSGSKSESASPKAAPQVIQTTTPVSAGVDTGTIPQGGIQAGAGGTADDGSMSGLLWGGGLMLVLAASGLALRRRDGLGS